MPSPGGGDVFGDVSFRVGDSLRLSKLPRSCRVVIVLPNLKGEEGTKKWSDRGATTEGSLAERLPAIHAGSP